MVGLLLGGRSIVEASFGQVALHADDGFDARRPRRLVEINDSMKHAVVGQPDGVHSQLLRTLDQRIDAAQTVEETELGMQVEMSERSVHTHRLAGPDQAVGPAGTPSRWSFGRLPAGVL